VRYEDLNFAVSVTKTLAAGPFDDLGAATLTGYVGGVTNRLLITPASGGTTIDGLDSTGVGDGFTILWGNQSATDVLIFPHLAAGSLAANRFSNANAGQVQIDPLGTALCTYVVNQWKFA
jgi:hypothetical protein